MTEEQKRVEFWVNSDVVYGEKGWVTEMIDGRFSVVVTDHGVLNRHFNKQVDWKYPKDSEDILYMTRAEMEKKKITRILKLNMQQPESLAELHSAKGRLI